MKKVFSIIAVVAVMVLVQLQPVSASSADSANADYAFEAFMSGVLSEDEFKSLSYQKFQLYDFDLNSAGWQYDFSFGETRGYSLLAKVQVGQSQIYEVEEAYLDAESYFTDYEGYPVYVTTMSYCGYNDGKFYDLKTGAELTTEAKQRMSQNSFRYRGGGNSTTEREEITYDHKTTDTYQMNISFPEYEAFSGSANCAVVAGANVIGYLDRFYENLVPNYQTYDVVLGQYIIYKFSSTEIVDLSAALYKAMGTDVGGAGTTFTGFKNGMQSYIQSKGYNVGFSDLVTWGNFNYANFKSAVSAGKPVALFMNGYSMVPDQYISTSGNTDTIVTGNYNSTHVVAAYGYTTITYYNSNNSVIATKNYLMVSSGLDAYYRAYVNIANTGIDHALAITIS